ncbi:MAG: DUF3429 domain-containing protein [Hydrogenovibrio sp.]
MHLARGLVYAGTLPFWFLLFASFGGVPSSLLGLMEVSRWGLAYAAVILSFISGIHWMLALEASQTGESKPISEPRQMTERQAKWLLLNSNVVALWAWLMWGLQAEPLSWFGMALGFVWLLWLEVRLAKLPRVWPGFWSLRWQASAIAVVSLVATGIHQLNQAAL